jgi:tetratricopeptide (TPR) repeat protein
MNADRRSRRVSLLQNLLLSLCSVIVVLVLLLVAEAIARHHFSSSAGSDSDPFVEFSAPLSSVFSITVGKDGRRYYKVTHPEVYAAANVTFPVEKAPHTFRVFRLGGSASAGWPHPSTENHGRYLERALQKAYPTEGIQVINVSGHGYASYRVRRVFDQIIDFDPDLLIIYSGNNEFIEKRSYFSDSFITTLSKKSHLLRWLHASFAGLRGDEMGIPWDDVWSKIERVSKEIRTDPKQYEGVKSHYAYSIEYMLKRAQHQNVPVLLLTVPVNLRDWHPNVSCNNLHGELLQQWQATYTRARKALIEAKYREAFMGFARAIDLEPMHAESFFLSAEALEGQGKFLEARDFYEKARDLDCNPFRAQSFVNDTVRRLARQYSNVYLVDLEALFEENAHHGIPGFDLFLDYVHANQKGNVLIAKASFETIVKAGLLNADGAVPSFSYTPAPSFSDTDGIDPKVLTKKLVEMPYDERKSLRVQRWLARLSFTMHQYESAKRNLELVCAIARQSTDPNMDRVRGECEEQLDAVSSYLENDERRILGLSYDEEYEKRLTELYQSMGMSR